MNLISPSPIAGGITRLGFTDEQGNGVLLAEEGGGQFTVYIAPECLHSIVEAGICLVFNRTDKNRFEVIVRPENWSIKNE